MRPIRFEIRLLGPTTLETWRYDEEIAGELPLPEVGRYAAPWTARGPRRRVASVLSVDPFGGRPVVVKFESVDFRHGEDDFESEVEGLTRAGWVRSSSEPRADAEAKEPEAYRTAPVSDRFEVSEARRILRLYTDEPDRAPTHWIGEDEDGTLWEWPAETAGWESRRPYTRDPGRLVEAPASMAVGTDWPGLALPPEPTA